MGDLGNQGSEWDDYVRLKRELGEEPGVEWGNEERWDRLFEKNLKFDTPVKHFVEIGQGAGKYTERMVKHYKPATVTCCDVSSEFLHVAKENLLPEYPQTRFMFRLLDTSRSDCLYRAVMGAASPPGDIDALISIDAMVHVDINVVFTYWINASLFLRKGGWMAMTMANAASKECVDKMTEEREVHFWTGGAFRGRFFYASTDMILNLLSVAGFEVRSLTPTFGGRDVVFVAEKRRDPEERVLTGLLDRSNIFESLL